MFKIITRGFYGFIIAGLLSLQSQAAATDPAAGACGSGGGSFAGSGSASTASQRELLERVDQTRAVLTNPALLETLGKIEADIISADAAISAGAGDAATSKESKLTLPILEGYVGVLQDAESWIAAQESASWDAYPWPTTTQRLPTVEEQILGYDVPAGKTLTDVLMDKVTLGVTFVSPEVKDPLKRYRLDRLYGQMQHLQETGKLTMDNLYEFGLILASLLDNPDLETDKLEVQDRYDDIPAWFNGYSWLAESLEAQTKGAFASPPPYVHTDDLVKALGVQDPAVIFEPSGHFGFHEMNKMHFRADKHHRRYLLGIGFKGSVHGGSINGAVTRYLHDRTHGSVGEYGSQYFWKNWPLAELLLTPIFEKRDSLSEEERRQIDFALYSAAVLPAVGLTTIVTNLPAGASQKVLGTTVIEALKKESRPITIFNLGLDTIFSRSILHPNFDLHSYPGDPKLREEGGMVKGEISHDFKTTLGWDGTRLGSCVYDFALPRSLKGTYTFTLREVKPEDGLTAEQKTQYDAIAAELSVADRPQNKVEHSPKEFRIRHGDEVKSLHWLSTGKWVNPPQWRGPEAYTWDTVMWYQENMQKVYDALLARGLELWSDEPIPVATLDMLQKAAVDL